MMLAEDIHGNLVEATPGARATCPACHHEVMAKCGDLVVWHFAHLAQECDPWWEPESPWHRWWKTLLPQPQVEVTIGPHRADIVANDRTVIELQHSSISVSEVAERERFYGRMVWLVNTTEVAQRKEYWGPDAFSWRFAINPDPAGFVRFRWPHCIRWVLHAQRPVLLDLGDRGVLWIGAIHGPQRCAGWGHLHDRAEIVERLRSGHIWEAR